MKATIGIIVLMSLFTIYLFGQKNDSASSQKLKEKQYDNYVKKNIKNFDVEAKKLKPNNDSALVYFIRPSAMIGAAMPLVLYCNTLDEKIIGVGSVKSGQYAFVFLKPDKYLITQFDGASKQEIILDILGNKTYYIRTYLQFNEIPPEEGNSMLKKCELSKKCFAIEYMVPEYLRP